MSKVLLIDDSNLTRTVARIALRRSGHEVIEAENAEHGADLARTQHPAAVVTGLPTSVLVGLGLLRRIHEAIRVPVIMIARDVSETTRAQCTVAGVVAILPPPIDGNDVARAVDDALGHTRGTRARAA